MRLAAIAAVIERGLADKYEAQFNADGKSRNPKIGRAGPTAPRNHLATNAFQLALATGSVAGSCSAQSSLSIDLGSGASTNLQWC